MQYTLCHLFLSDRRSPCLFVSLHIANRVKIASLGGIEAIIKAMSTHKDHSGVQKNACGALNNLAANQGIILISSLFSIRSCHIPHITLVFPRPAIAQQMSDHVDLMRLVKLAMARFPDSEDIQSRGQEIISRCQ